MKNHLLLFILVIVVLSAHGQGIIRGKITDATGETLIGATVFLKADPGTGTVTDLDGNYSLKISSSEPQILIVSYIGYEREETSVNPLNGEVIIKNFVLRSSAQNINQVEVTAKASRARDSYMEKVKMNSSISIDYISSQTISKIGDGNVTAAVARIPGVSTSNGFITVRGINDRYVKTTINGSVIPTLDPFTNNIKLDLFPTSLVDNVVISKTASPDLPGDWSGAYISINTKDFPDKLTVNVESSYGYNPQSSFKDVLSSETSSTDWLGYDDGFREYDHESFSEANLVPTQYEEMLGLGLNNYYSSLGVTSDWSAGSNTGEVYFKLGLVQLGLLPPASFDDPAAIANAKSLYLSGGYKDQAFYNLNKDAAASGQAFSNNWNLITKSRPAEYSQSLSIGNQINLFKRPLGFLVGFRYGSSIKYDEQSVANRASVTVNGDVLLASETTQKVSSENNGWNALANLSYKISPNNTISFLFMPNMLGVNKVRDAIESGSSTSYQYTYNKDQFYEYKKQFVYQLKNENYLKALKVKTILDVSYTDGLSNAPDFRTFQFYSDSDNLWRVDTKESDTYRFYRYLDENYFDAKFNVEIPVKELPGLARKIKTGVAYQINDREWEQISYHLVYPTALVLIPNNDIDEFFSYDNFGIVSVNTAGSSYLTLPKYFERYEYPSNHTVGKSNIYAGYLMADYSINFFLKASGGLRIEYTDLYTDIYEFDQKGYKPNDLRRNVPGELFLINPGDINEWSFLPSVNLIYKLNIEDNSPTNLRFGFSQSIARPSLRELSESSVLDFELDEYVFGRSDLKIVRINNYDIRYENYFKNNDNLSISLFYKSFNNHIELIKTFQGFTWQNVDKSRVIGIELEGKKQFSKNFDLRANVTLVESRTEFTEYFLSIEEGIKNFVPIDTVSRAVFGQAPFVVNGIFTYSADSIGLFVSASYNLQGKKLVLTSADLNPDIYELPAHTIDVKISKNIGKYFNASLKVRNLLNESTTRSYLYDDGDDIIYDQYRYGTSYILGLSYKL